MKEEEERRRQITVEFQKALGNVTNMMAESNDQNCKLGEENKNMAKRLSSIYEEVKNRQTEVDRFSRQIDIERQLAETRFAKVSTEFLIEKEKLIGEKELLKKRAEHLTLELRSSLEKSIALEKTISELRGQLNGYTGRYEEFQKTISKSSKIFDQCKSEIANMNDQIFNQKKELLDWQTKHQKDLTTIRELSIINDQKGKFIEQVNKKQSQLTKLCRQLQAERTACINALRTNGHNPDDFLANLTFDDTEPEVETFKPDLKASSATVEKENNVKVEKEKPKRGKQKNKEDAKKRNELHKELFKVKVQDSPVGGKDPLAVKELHLAELKEELKRMQSQVDKIQSTGTEVKPKESPKENQNDDGNVKEEVTNVADTAEEKIAGDAVQNTVVNDEKAIENTVTQAPSESEIQINPDDLKATADGAENQNSDQIDQTPSTDIIAKSETSDSNEVSNDQENGQPTNQPIEENQVQ